MNDENARKLWKIIQEAGDYLNTKIQNYKSDNKIKNSRKLRRILIICDS